MKAIVIALLALVAVAQAGILLAPTTYQVNAAPWAYAAPAVVAAVPHSAGYVAANRGSVHVAPLPGHIVGSQQLNLSPAPGTLW